MYTTFRAAVTYHSTKDFLSTQHKEEHFCANQRLHSSRLLIEFGLTGVADYLHKNSRYNVSKTLQVGARNKLVKTHKFFQKLDQAQVQSSDFSLRDASLFCPKRPTDCKIVRFLLDFSRTTATAICISGRIPVYPDKSNQNLLYSRNSIRKQILPALQLVLNPKAEEAIFRFAELAYQDYKLTSKLCRQNTLSL